MPTPKKQGTRKLPPKRPARHQGHDFHGSHPAFGVRVIFEDDTIIVIEKPSGLLTVATDKEGDKTAYRAVRDWIARQKGVDPDERGAVYLGVVHRLDRDTSGVMVFVKTEEARAKLTSDWMGQVSDRRYIAVVEGKPRGGEEGTVRNWLRQNKAFRVYAVNTQEPGTEEAITHWKTVRPIGSGKPDEPERSLVELKLETGRTNQIRVHMAGLGSPVAGDRKYGRPPQVGGVDGAWPKRLALHARRIEFIHPKTGKTVAFESPVPVDMKKLIKG